MPCENSARKRSKTMAFRCTPEEYELIANMAAWSGMSRQDYIMARLTGTEITVRPSSRTQRALRDSMKGLAERLLAVCDADELDVFVASKMLTKRHVAFEHFGRHVLHCFFALPSIKAASMRWLAPLNSTSLPWWTILSIMADASLSSPRTVPHFENSMFVVNIMLRLS